MRIDRGRQPRVIQGEFQRKTPQMGLEPSRGRIGDFSMGLSDSIYTDSSNGQNHQASFSMFVTADQKRQLCEMGVSEDEIYNMSPTDAHERLGNRQPHSVEDDTAVKQPAGNFVADATEISRFVETMFCHATEGYVQLRCFLDKPQTGTWGQDPETKEWRAAAPSDDHVEW